MRAAIVFLGACWSSSTPAPQPPAAPKEAVAGFDRAMLVGYGPFDNVFTTYRIEGDHLVALGSTTIGPKVVVPPSGKDPWDGPGEPTFTAIGEFVGRDHFIARVAKDRIVRVTRDGVKPVRIPDIEAVERVVTSPWTLVDLVFDGESAWWSRCVEEGYEDGGRCAAWKSVEVYPGHRTSDESVGGGFAMGFANTPAAGYAVDGKTCTTPTGAHAIFESEDEREDTFATAWVDPTHLLVVGAYYPEFRGPSITGWALWDRCETKIDSGDDTPHAGPDDLWASGDRVFKGAKLLGTTDGDVHFR